MGLIDMSTVWLAHPLRKRDAEIPVELFSVRVTDLTPTGGQSLDCGNMRCQKAKAKSLSGGYSNNSSLHVDLNDLASH